MTATLSDNAKALLDAPELATIATIDPDGRPQLSVVWVARDGDDVLISTLEGRRKHKNLVRDPRATVLIYPAANPYTYLEIRGTATIEPDPDAELIDRLARAYTGKAWAEPGQPGRVIVRVSAERVVEH